MKKLIFILILILSFSCEKDEPCSDRFIMLDGFLQIRETGLGMCGYRNAYFCTVNELLLGDTIYLYEAILLSDSKYDKLQWKDKLHKNERLVK